MNRQAALLINPPTGLYIREDRCQAPVKGMIAPTPRTPIDLGTLAAVLEARGARCRIRDYPAEGGSWADLRRDLGRDEPGLLVVSTTTPTVRQDLRACALAKSVCPRIRTVAKGAHFLAAAESALEAEPALDIAIRGESEAAIAEIWDGRAPAEIPGLTYREGRFLRRTGPRPFLACLDDLPWPARHLMRNELYLRPDTGEKQTTVLAARGCPHACAFCLAGLVHGRETRTRSPAGMAAEIRHCRQRHGIRSFYLQADTFTLERDWALGVCEALRGLTPIPQWVCNSRVDTLDLELASRMREAGCWGVALGMESGSQDILARSGKHISLEASRRAVEICRRVGLKTSLMFLLGMPWDSERTIRETVAFARTLPGHVYEFNLAYPFPGTRLRALAEEMGLLEGLESDGLDFTRASMRTLYLSPERLDRLRKRAMLAVYARPSYLFRMAREAGSAGAVLRQFRYAWARLAAVLRNGGPPASGPTGDCRQDWGRGPVGDNLTGSGRDEVRDASRALPEERGRRPAAGGVP